MVCVGSDGHSGTFNRSIQNVAWYILVFGHRETSFPRGDSTSSGEHNCFALSKPISPRSLGIYSSKQGIQGAREFKSIVSCIAGLVLDERHSLASYSHPD